jgi:hypothetical protein
MAMREAQQVDWLLKQYPSMSHEEAVEMLQKQLHPAQAARLASYQGTSY